MDWLLYESGLFSGGKEILVSMLALIALLLLSVVIFMAVFSRKQVTQMSNESAKKVGPLEKKHPLAKLENYRMLFLATGTFLSFGFGLVLIEYPTLGRSLMSKVVNMGETEDELIEIPLTEMPPPPPPPPPPKIKEPEIVEVEDDVEIEEPEIEMDLEDDTVQVVEIEEDLGFEEEEIVEEAPLEWGLLQQNPEFPGGMDGFYAYIQKNFTIPSRDVEEGNTGRIFVSFVIEKDGSLSKVTVLRGINSRLDNIAKGVVEKSPKWKPGMNAGFAQRVKCTMPIVVK